MINLLKSIKAKMMRFYYFRLSFLSSNIKRISYYRFVKDGREDILYKDLDLKKNSIVFDIGGYIGGFSGSILKLCDCTIYIFEPVKEFYEIIVDKYKYSDKIHIFNFGLGGFDLEAKINKSGESSSLYTENIKTDYEKIKIESIMGFIFSNQIIKIDLMKINIEGGEYDLLDSLVDNQDAIESINTLLIQFHDFVPDAVNKRNILQKKLNLTHQKVFDYPFIWEKWVRVKNG